MVENRELVTITGATGHIGNVLARRLAGEGRKVRALVLRSNCRIDYAKACQELGFTRRPFRESLADSLRWFRYTRMLPSTPKQAPIPKLQ